MLLVKGKHEDRLGSCLSLWCLEDELVVVDVSDLLDLTDWSAIWGFKLGIERDIVTESAVIVLELLEANALHGNSSLTRSRTSLRM